MGKARALSHGTTDRSLSLQPTRNGATMQSCLQTSDKNMSEKTPAEEMPPEVRWCGKSLSASTDTPRGHQVGRRRFAEERPAKDSPQQCAYCSASLVPRKCATRFSRRSYVSTLAFAILRAISWTRVYPHPETQLAGQPGFTWGRSLAAACGGRP